MTTVTAKKVLLKDEFGNPLIPYTENKGVYELFDTKISDHILTGSEATGWALQGTYTLASDTDFYNRCLEEKQASTVTKTWMKNNIIPYGSITQTNSTLSNFSATNYATLNLDSNYFLSNPWTMYIKFRLTANNVVNPIISPLTQYKGLHIYLDTSGKLNVYFSENGTAWYSELDNSRVGTNVYAVDTDYWLKIACTRVESTSFRYSVSYSTDGETYTQDWYEQIVPAIYSDGGQFVLGRDFNSKFLNGTIDLSETYLEGADDWQGSTYLDLYKHVNGHMYYDITDKHIVDDIFNRTGLAWYYGVDETNQKIFLPRNIWFDQMTSDIGQVGNHIKAGLPNIQGSIKQVHTALDNQQNGALSSTRTGEAHRAYNADDGTTQYNTVAIDASLSNGIYGNSNTVQPNAIMKLLYICVGNTLIKSSVIDAEQAIGEIRNFETTRANVDLANVTKNGKVNAVSWNIPDYDSGIDVTMPFTAPSDGVIAISTYKPSTGNHYVYINDTIVAGQYNAGNSYYTNIGGEFVLGKGDVVSADSAWKVVVVKFFPMKGVN